MAARSREQPGRPPGPGRVRRRECEYIRHRDERKAPLDTVAPTAGDTISYTYDFGDDWVHHIEAEKVLSTAPGATYPRCLTGRRACPPRTAAALGAKRTSSPRSPTPSTSSTKKSSTGSATPSDPDHLGIDAINKHLTAREPSAELVRCSN